MNIRNTDERVLLNKPRLLRLSNLRLMIETGSHNNVDSNDRHCPFCTSVIIDEHHFLIKCPTYSDVRQK